MKTIIFLLIVSGTNADLPDPPAEAAFDHFIELFHAALATGDEDIYSMFFSEKVRFLQEGGQPEYLPPERLFRRLDEFGRPDELLSHLARGFVRLDRDSIIAFATLHNAPRHHHHVRINGSSVRLRKLPGSKGDVIALFNQGLYSGATDPRVPLFCDRSTGTEWLQLEISHPRLGLIKGYMAAEYLELMPRSAPKALMVEEVDGRLLITELSAL